MIAFTLLKKIVPFVLHVDCETLWTNLMNDKVPCNPEIGYIVREYIARGIISSICLIPCTSNPLDAMTKVKPNYALQVALKSNRCITPCKRVFMLRDSSYRYLTWITTSKVPMPTDRQLHTNSDTHRGITKIGKEMQVSTCPRGVNSSNHQSLHEMPASASRDHNPLNENPPRGGLEVQFLSIERHYPHRYRDISAHLIS